MKKKQLLITGAAVALTAVLAVGGTLAYMTAITETKKNVFTSDKGIKIELEEKEWETSGKKKAENYTPGDVIAKDPAIVNKCEENIWSGIKLDYIGTDRYMTNGEYKSAYYTQEDFKKYGTIDVNEDHWILIATNQNGSELYAFNQEVAVGATTDPTLFSNLAVNAQIKEEKTSDWTKAYKKVVKNKYDSNGKLTSEIVYEEYQEKETPEVSNSYVVDGDGNYIEAFGLPRFTVDVTGYAVQYAEVEFETAKTQMIDLVNQGIDTTSADYFLAK